jgi:hypothetical protein
MNIDHIISKIRRDFSKYADAGLLDENELYSDAISELKRFGNDICETHEQMIHVVNGFADLPQNFFSLKMALWCEPDFYQTKNIEYHTLISSSFYKERAEATHVWNECQECCVQKTEKVIKENIYFNGGSAQFVYKNPILLRLVPGFERTVCAKGCLNGYDTQSPYHINILKRRRLQANFNKGSIYMQYVGLPMDEEGRIDIPETPNGHLDKYMEYFLKRRFTENMIGNNDAQGLQNLYQAFLQQESIALKNASNELKLTNMDFKNLRKKGMAQNRMETRKYEIQTWH